MIKIYYYINEKDERVYEKPENLLGFTSMVELIADTGKMLHNIRTNNYIANPLHLFVGLEDEWEEVPLDKSY